MLSCMARARDQREHLLHEVHGEPGRHKVELPPFPPGAVLVEAELAEDKTFSVKAPGLVCDSFGRPSPESGVAERALWCTSGQGESVKVKAKTSWTLRFYGPAAAAPLVDSVMGTGTDVLACRSGGATVRLVSHAHPDRLLNSVIDDIAPASAPIALPWDATSPSRSHYLPAREVSKREAEFTLDGPCLVQVSALPWCAWTATVVTRPR